MAKPAAKQSAAAAAKVDRRSPRGRQHPIAQCASNEATGKEIPSARAHHQQARRATAEAAGCILSNMTARTSQEQTLNSRRHACRSVMATTTTVRTSPADRSS